MLKKFLKKVLRVLFTAAGIDGCNWVAFAGMIFFCGWARVVRGKIIE